MNISCISCPARYGVPDAKLVGKRVRVTCKRCGAILLVDGTVSPPRVSLRRQRGTERCTRRPDESCADIEFASRAETRRRVSRRHAGRPAAERRRGANRAPLSRSTDQRRVARLARGNGTSGSPSGRSRRSLPHSGAWATRCPLSRRPERRGLQRRATTTVTTLRRVSFRAAIRLMSGPRISTTTSATSIVDSSRLRSTCRCHLTPSARKTRIRRESCSRRWSSHSRRLRPPPSPRDASRALERRHGASARREPPATPRPNRPRLRSPPPRRENRAHARRRARTRGGGRDSICSPVRRSARRNPSPSPLPPSRTTGRDSPALAGKIRCFSRSINWSSKSSNRSARS